MKTLTITLHNTDNCGSSLQAFALQQFLKKNNIDNQIIDYCPNYLRYNGSCFRSFVKSIIYFKATLTKKIKFNQFQKANLILTDKKYTSLKNLRADNLNADCFIAGSDQLWNGSFECGRDPAFYLDFTKGNKVTYAVSLGKERLDANNKIMIHNCAREYQWISVRESSSVPILENIVNVPVNYVCDPVFLIDKSYYFEIASDVPVNGKYILVYLAQAVDKDEMNRMLNILKQKYGCKIVLIGTSVKKCDCDIHLKSVSPNEFLTLINNAEYVVSNSFHATMFTLIFEKQFVTLLPKENGTRITSVLNQLGLQSHGLTRPEFLENDISDNEYRIVRKKLLEFSKESGEALLNRLSAIENNNMG